MMNDERPAVCLAGLLLCNERCRMKVLATAVLAVVAMAAGVARGEERPGVLKGLRVGHPRLMVLDADVARLKGLIKSDPVAKGYFEQVRKEGEKLLAQPVSERVLVGPRLLWTSRQVLNRVATLGGLYRLTGDRRYADRCREEMLAAARFKDWNPSHFLDVAEMTNALGIGYDWIYGVLTEAERKEIREAIVNKGLNEGLKVYATGTGWPKRTNNWNQVCNGGLGVGALAVADAEPEVARKVLEAGRASLPLAMAQFAPDGGCVEGPGYWAYATEYTAYYLAALKTALGTDFGFLSAPGFAETGTYRMESIGPTGKTFNYADAHDGVSPAAQMFWLARAFGRPAYAAHERELVRRGIVRGIGPFHLMWYDPEGTDEDVARVPAGAMYKRINVAFLRTGWDASAGFVGFKGGDNAASHAHLDLGEFVYDAGGVRWAMDLGPDDYNLPGYFGKQRWDYYRLRTEGQNTLTIDGENQDVKGTAKIVSFSSGEGGGPRRAVADLTAGYKGVSRVTREVELKDDGGLVVRDEVRAEKPVDVVWHMHTAAKIRIGLDGTSAVLVLGGKELNARIEEPEEGARFELAVSDTPPAVKSTVPTGQTRKAGQKLVVRLGEKVSELHLVVSLTPVEK
jgi:hypothetical protein